ncbi:MAG TPA: V-type ATP synthase subunit D [Thermoplasmata archaeon]|nr:V-type ATP synthase subunit D [Thermoplasmata archaeon]
MGVEGVKPTRMELIITRRKRALAEKGHELLTEKRDALIVQFFDLVERRLDMRERVLAELREIYREVLFARMASGDARLDGLLHSARDRHEIRVHTTSVMGIGIPRIVQRGVGGAGPVSLVSSDMHAEIAASRMAALMESLVALGEVESSVGVLGREIEKTKRRVNALEHVFIPRLREVERTIETHLEEMEREDFFRRKRMKALFERRERAAG